jgi:hypothetical protein
VIQPKREIFMYATTNFKRDSVRDQYSTASQLIQRIKEGKICLYIKVNNFHAGDIILNKSTFLSIKRTAKNIMRMFNGSLGINSEILNNYNFEFIEIPYEGTILRTTRKKWITEGKVSPFSNSKVDQQILLPISKINMEHLEIYEHDKEQLSLFGKAL